MFDKQSMAWSHVMSLSWQVEGVLSIMFDQMESKMKIQELEEKLKKEKTILQRIKSSVTS